MSVTKATLLGDSFGTSSSGTIPVGGIIMWSGTIANIPIGWALCDGNTTNGTPDLRNRFIVGAHSGTGDGKSASTGPGFNVDTGALNSVYTPGNYGGEHGHKLTIAELASHNHTISNLRPVDGRRYDSAPEAFYRTNSGDTNTNLTGSDKFHENRPPYYALAFIMRVS